MTVEDMLTVMDDLVHGEDPGDWPVLINDAVSGQQREVLAVMMDAENRRVLLELAGRLAR